MQNLLELIQNCDSAETMISDIREKMKSAKNEYGETEDYRILYNAFCLKAEKLGLDNKDHYLYKIFQPDKDYLLVP